MKAFDPSHIIIHHTATDDDHLLLDFDNIEDFHERVRGWQAIGYHFLVEDVEGETVCVVGRHLGQIGAHTRGWNADAIGVAVAGNYEEDSLPRRKLERLVEVVAGLCLAFDIPVERIMRHNEVRNTKCPGRNFPWNEFIDLVGEYLIGMRYD